MCNPNWQRTFPSGAINYGCRMSHECFRHVRRNRTKRCTGKSNASETNIQLLKGVANFAHWLRLNFEAISQSTNFLHIAKFVLNYATDLARDARTLDNATIRTWFANIGLVCLSIWYCTFTTCMFCLAVIVDGASIHPFMLCQVWVRIPFRHIDIIGTIKVRLWSTVDPTEWNSHSIRLLPCFRPATTGLPFVGGSICMDELRSMGFEFVVVRWGEKANVLRIQVIVALELTFTSNANVFFEIR